MEAPTGPPRLPKSPTQPNIDNIKRKLLQKGVYPTPKIIHTLRKKQLQKSNRRLAKQSLTQPHLTDSQKQAISEETHFQTLKSEYKSFTRAINAKTQDGNCVSMIGKPWERSERNGLREIASSSDEFGGEKLKGEHLRELSEILEEERDKFKWLLDDDVEVEDGLLEKKRQSWAPPKRRWGEAEAMQFLIDKLSGRDLSMKDWKFLRMMKQSELQFTEGQMLKLVDGLGEKGEWRHALSVVEWVYNLKEHRHYKSRFVYTKLLAVLGKSRRPQEALQIFKLMLGDFQIYPDMAAYHSISVTLGQAGYLKELMNVIECMRKKPSKRIKNMRRKNWDPVLEPDVVVFNAVLNACVPSRQWKGVSWVFEQLRKGGLKPNGPTYGLAMEVMLESGKYDLVHEFFAKMRRSGEAPKALTYRVLVRTFWEEGKVNEAVRIVRDMEQRGVVGTASVYYELACCLCKNGRWQEAMVEVEKLKKLPRSKPLSVTFTGMITSSMDGGHFHDCISIFEHINKQCSLDIGVVNAMLNVYGRNDMFSKAKELFEEIKKAISLSNNCESGSDPSLLSPDIYTYGTMLEASASAFQWEYFEYVYKEMALSGCQLDQTKHTYLLVEASRAGKGHLLEHAFDRILEDGEIPDLSFFTELICQATVQRDYERVVSILKAMAHVPFQVSENQWTDLFERNGDRINQDSLKELLHFLGDLDFSRDASVSTLLRSLRFLCGPHNLREISSSVSFGNASIDDSYLDGNNMRSDCDESENIHNLSKLMSRSSSDDCNGHGKATLFTNLEDLTDDMFGENGDGFDGRFSNDIDDDNFDIDDSYVESNLPSANEILETWKESRAKDGILFSFQVAGE